MQKAPVQHITKKQDEIENERTTNDTANRK